MRFAGKTPQKSPAGRFFTLQTGPVHRDFCGAKRRKNLQVRQTPPPPDTSARHTGIILPFGKKILSGIVYRVYHPVAYDLNP
ncbi:MAG: hypothetical protein LBB61_04055 [Treponema sp.]|nr:hypothetical protein [Treponema sp.]